MMTITRSAMRSTSLRTCELTITFGLRAELLEQCDEVRAARIRRSRLVEHETCGSLRGRRTFVRGAALAERVDHRRSRRRARDARKCVLGRTRFDHAVKIPT